MKTLYSISVLQILAALVLCCAAADAVPAGERLQQAIYAEEIEGDLTAAIAGYEEISNDASASSDEAALALYRQGMCYYRLDKNGEATVALTRLVNQYAGHTNLVEKTLPVLEKLQYFDPALLMPPETLAYFELGRAEGQDAMNQKMFQDTPLEDLLMALSQSNPDMMRSGPQMLMAGLMNPAMQEDFNKVRGMAVGLVDIGPAGPAVVAVIHVGESSMLRGMLMTGFSMGGIPGGKVAGMSTFSFQGQPVEVAYDDKVFLISSIPGKLQWMIRQYKHLSNDASLASGNPVFGRFGKAIREQNVSTLWLDADGLYTRVAQQMPNMPPQVRISAGAINISSIDDLVVATSIQDEELVTDSRIIFKEGISNLFYEMIKTPGIRRDGIQGVPAEAVALATFDLDDSASMQFSQLRQLASAKGGVDLPAELVDSIDQITLFALPGTDVNSPMPIRPGLVISCSDTAPVLGFLEGILASSNGLPVTVEAVDGAVLAAMDQDVINAAKDALAGNHSVNSEGVLNAGENQDIDAAQKMVLLNLGGLVQAGGSRAQYAQPHPVVTEEMNRQIAENYANLARALEGMNITIHTEESANELVLKTRLTGVPSIGLMLEAIQQITATDAVINEELQRKEREERLAKLVPAEIMQTQTVPVIDGELGDCWDAAVVYPVAKTLTGIQDAEQGEPIPGNEFAADFRMLWDAKNLYVFIDVTDSTPNRNPDLLWPYSDNTILYIDATDAKRQNYGATDYEFAFCWDPVSPFMQENKHGRTRNVEYEIKTTEKGYRIEAAFPWATLGTPNPSAGTVIGMDVQASDNQAGPQRNLVIAWQDETNGTWQYPVLFGRAELVAQQD
jgi:hypothetical protein